MNECIPVEELGALDRLPADNPRRRHVATCPRCSALVFAHDEFIRAQAIEGADARGADAHLARFIAERVESMPVETTRPSGGPRGGRGRWFGFALWRPALVGAMLVVMAVAVLRWQPWVTEEIVYRGEPGTQFTGVSATAGDDVVVLRWNAIARADAYRVSILSEDLIEITRLPPTSDLSLRFDPRSADGTLRPWFWQVTALAEGGEILSSDPQRLP